MTAQRNTLSQRISWFDRLPGQLRKRAVSLVMGQMVPFVGTARLVIEEMTEERVVVRVPDLRRNRNHIRSVHAAAIALAAETASGFVVGMNVPDSGVPLIKTLEVHYRKRSRGALRAESTLSPEERQRIREEPKGEVAVTTRITDASGDSPVECRMVWAWVPKQRAPHPAEPVRSS